jgi:hypothetical protein
MAFAGDLGRVDELVPSPPQLPVTRHHHISVEGDVKAGLSISFDGVSGLPFIVLFFDILNASLGGPGARALDLTVYDMRRVSRTVYSAISARHEPEFSIAPLVKSVFWWVLEQLNLPSPVHSVELQGGRLR